MQAAPHTAICRGDRSLLTSNLIEQVDERNVIRARCVLEFGRGSRSVSYTRQVAHNINLGLVVDSDVS